MTSFLEAGVANFHRCNSGNHNLSPPAATLGAALAPALAGGLCAARNAIIASSRSPKGIAVLGLASAGVAAYAQNCSAEKLARLRAALSKWSGEKIVIDIDPSSDQITFKGGAQAWAQIMHWLPVQNLQGGVFSAWMPSSWRPYPMLDQLMSVEDDLYGASASMRAADGSLWGCTVRWNVLWGQCMEGKVLWGRLGQADRNRCLNAVQSVCEEGGMRCLEGTTFCRGGPLWTAFSGKLLVRPGGSPTMARISLVQPSELETCHMQRNIVRVTRRRVMPMRIKRRSAGARMVFPRALQQIEEEDKYSNLY